MYDFATFKRVLVASEVKRTGNSQSPIRRNNHAEVIGAWSKSQRVQRDHTGHSVVTGQSNMVTPTVMTSAYDVRVMTNDADNYVSRVTSSSRPLCHQSNIRAIVCDMCLAASGNQGSQQQSGNDRKDFLFVRRVLDWDATTLRRTRAN